MTGSTGERRLGTDVPQSAEDLAGLMGAGPVPAERAPAEPWPAPVALSRTASRSRSARRRFASDMVVGGLLMVLLHLFVLQISVVKGHSMEPSLMDGDRLVVDRLSYQVMEVSRNDVVVLRYPRNPEIDFVKRIVGVPGDWVSLTGGLLYVNGEPQSGEYDIYLDSEDMPPEEVPPGHYFVLGDNRPISCDSREFGLVAQELLKGKVRARFWPLDRLSIF